MALYTGDHVKRVSDHTILSIRTTVLISLLLHALLLLSFRFPATIVPRTLPVMVDLGLDVPPEGGGAAPGQGGDPPGSGAAAAVPGPGPAPRPAVRRRAPLQAPRGAALRDSSPVGVTLSLKEQHRVEGEAERPGAVSGAMPGPGNAAGVGGLPGGGSGGIGTGSGGGSGTGTGTGTGTGSGFGVGSGSGGGSGDSAARQRSHYLAEHFAYIREIIHRQVTYPGRALREGWSGKVRVSFVIQEDGSVSDIRILGSSGYEVLDQSALEAIRRAAPFPRPPVRAELRMPITYYLER